MEEVSSESQEKEKKKDFYEFATDDETSANSIDAEATEYFSNARKLECLSKYPTIKNFFLSTTQQYRQVHQLSDSSA